MRRSEAGQSESGPEGQPEGRCGACGRASQARTREALGNRPCPLRGAAFSGWTGQAKGGRKPAWMAACSRLRPEERAQGRRSRCDGASERRFCYYQGASFGAPSPLKVEGRELKVQLARRREDASAWLFEILNPKCVKRTSAQHLQLSSPGFDRATQCTAASVL